MTDMNKLFGIFAAAALASACTGSIDIDDDNPRATGGGASGGSGDTPAPGGTGAGGVTAPAEHIEFACADRGGVVEMGATPMRRLSFAEYDHTVSDLFGVAAQPSQSFTVTDQPALGYDNNLEKLQISAGNGNDFMIAAERLAYQAVRDLTKLLPCTPATSANEACVGQFIDKFGLRAYRRPLEAAERDVLLNVYRSARAAGDDLASGIHVVLTSILQSPQFLYRAEIGAGAPKNGLVSLTGYEIASRLSYLIWASMPDDALFAAAASGALGTDAGVLAEAERLIKDPRARRGLARFTEQWVPAGEIDPANPFMNKDTTLIKDWQTTYPAYLRAEMTKFLDHVTWEDGGRLQTFLTAPYTFMDRYLVSLYRATDPTARASDTLVKVNQDPARYAGFLTKAGFQAAFARPDATRTAARGLYVRERLLCSHVPPPNGNDPAIADAQKKAEAPPPGGQTKREFLASLITESNCVGCHNLFNSMGLAFENFDAAGRFRMTEAGKPIDTSGELVSLGADVDGPFANHIDMIGKVARSQAARDCFVRQVFRYAAGRAENDADACTLASIAEHAAATGYDVRQMILGVVTSEGFRFRRDN